MRSAAFTPLLYLVSTSGSILNSATTFPGGAQISTTLPAGSYYIVASSNTANATGAYMLSINVLPMLSSVTPPFGVPGTTMPVTLTGNRFGVPMTVIVGSGITASNVNVTSPTSATATFDIPAGLTAGTTSVTVTTGVGISNPVSFAIFPVIPSISPGQIISGSLDTSDGRNPFFTNAFADLYQLTLASTTQITIDMRSADFPPRLYLVSASGSVNFGTTFPGGAQISTTLSAGTYYIVASSNTANATGAYMLSINVLPMLSSVAPFGVSGTTMPVTLTGNRFGAAMTVIVGSGITASNVNVTSPTSATATFTIPAGLTAGTTSVTVITAAGTSNPATFSIFPSIPSISPGQTISASLDPTDGRNPFFSSAFADFYQLTLASTTQITIDMKSNAFDTYLYLLSASGSILASNNDSGGTTDSQIVITLSAGTYYIEASSFLGGVTGPYTLSITGPE
jgi:hypothetical protein